MQVMALRNVTNCFKVDVAKWLSCRRYSDEKATTVPPEPKSVAEAVESRRLKIVALQKEKGSSLGTPWMEREESWKSLLSYFSPKHDIISPDVVRIIHTKIDYRPKTIKKFFNRKLLEREIEDQQFIQARYSICGPDLAAASFVVYRGGAVQFCGEQEWVKLKEGEYSAELPEQYVAGLYLNAIDAKGMTLHYEGLENLKGLIYLTSLSLEGLPNIDDFCIDKISCEYRHTLEHLNISYCPKVTHRALSCFYRFEKLKTLKVHGIADSVNFKLACMMLEDVLPNLKIEGVSYDVPDKSFLDMLPDSKGGELLEAGQTQLK